MCKYCEKKIRNLKNAKITPQTYIGKRFGNKEKPIPAISDLIDKFPIWEEEYND